MTKLLYLVSLLPLQINAPLTYVNGHMLCSSSQFDLLSIWVGLKADVYIAFGKNVCI